MKRLKKKILVDDGGAEQVLRMFRDQVVVDLGSGLDLGYFAAALARAKGYVGVDKYERRSSFYHNRETIRKFFEMSHFKLSFDVEPIPGSSVQDDMLHFLRRLPDHSVSILASGIDGYVIPNREYFAAVSEEIKRVLHKKGIFFSHQSMLDIGWGEDEKFERVLTGSFGRDFPGDAAFKVRTEESESSMG